MNKNLGKSHHNSLQGRWKKLKVTVVIPFLALLFACSNNEGLNVSSTHSSSPSNLLVEDNKSPLNVHNTTPQLSWYANVKKQTAYQIRVASSEQLLTAGTADLWDSGKVNTQVSINIPYLGETLNANQKAVWQVRVWSADNTEPSDWSQPAFWEMGLLSKDDWQAKWLQVQTRTVAEVTPARYDWIQYAANVHPDITEKLKKHQISKQMAVVEQLKEQPTASLFRHSFKTDPTKKIVRAKLHSTAGGYYEIFLNGQKVDDRLMDPGQTDYDQRILYNTDEVGTLLSKGQNTIAVHLGSGWYDEDIAFSKWHNPDASTTAPKRKSLAFGQPTFIAQLEVIYADGTNQIVASDEQWLSHPSPILKEGLFSGELYDANEVVTDWNVNTDAHNLSNWQPVKVLSKSPTKRLEPQLLPAIRAVKKVTPVKLYQPRENVWVLDFGQNFTGVPTVNLDKLGLKAGQAINMRYGEWADIDGNLSQKSGGGAPLLKQVDTYIASGNDEKTWTPTFTWHGFRFLELTGLNKAPALDAVVGHLVRSDVEIVGQFKSSNPLVNRIHDMALWSYEGNLMAVPMDCPIRERAGWTGDAHAALITGNYNYNMQKFWQKYLGDFETSAHIAPAVVPGKRSHGGNYDWAVAEVIIAWEHYRHHGDIQVLAEQYESMLEYMNAAEKQLTNNLLRKGYGDWCDPVLKPGMTRKRCNPEYTTPTMTTSGFLAHGAELMSKMSALLNKPEQAKHYQALFNRIAAQFHKEFYDPKTGHYGSQTADAMALRFGIAPKEIRQSVADALNKDVLEKWKGHGSIGALGQTYVYRALSDYGYADTAYGIFTAEGYPGYQWQFDKLQATTLWERKGVWDPAKDPEGRNPPGRSLNHPFHSGYDGWFYEGLGGIRPLGDNPGYQHFALSPVFPKDLDWVETSYKTGYGKIVSNWKRQGDSVVWHFEVPNNTSANVTLPGQSSKVYEAGVYQLQVKP
ncbi:family 78 glycoside hydrolase catalytic domain [Catenovulum adriaticum]|uniref:alpha-L-rhamnosidase n=1 Tax=Catenovulum adriaticum TaxID=2984846 RepID=A0ABY7ATD9_9ALTE|nr:family 78 glycoside hydrolase catalytic domain [Catenovulum sp. TS8]WAJ71926.1 glycoside hydrolase family 78 protein [Catenovulum sp. TS8]